MKTYLYSEKTKSFGISEDKRAFLMVYFRMPDEVYNIQSKIKSEDLYTEPGYGLELESHVTLYPCMDNDINVEDIKKYLLATSAIDARLTNVSKFEQDGYDVIKCDVDSNQLRLMNNELSKQFKSTSKYKEYHPHMTIAYVKPKSCDNLIGSTLGNNKLTPIGYVFSYYDGDENKKITWR